MSNTAELLRRGIAAAKAGQRQLARDLLSQVIEQDERNEQAWLWLSGAVELLDDRHLCLQNVLVINPGNVHAQAGLRLIEQAINRRSGEVEGTPPKSASPSPRPALPEGGRAIAPPLGEEEGSKQRSTVPSPQPSLPGQERVSDDSAVLVQTAQSYLMKMQDVPQAIELLNRALEVQPANGQAYLLLGDAYLQQDNMAQAARYFSRAARYLAPDSRPGREARLKLMVLEESVRPRGIPAVVQYPSTVSAADMRRSLEEPGTYGYADRPGCVTLYTVLAALSGTLALLVGVVLAIAGPRLVSYLQGKSIPLAQGLLESVQGPLGTAIWIAAGLALLTAVVSLVIAAGLWQMRNWARIVVVVGNILGVVSVVCPVVVLFVTLSNIFTTSLLAGLPTGLLVIPLAGLALLLAAAYWFATNRELFD
jgi:hypothetical protein